MLNLIFKIERYKWNKEYRVYVSNLGHFKDEHKKRIAPLTNPYGYLVIKTPYGLKSAHRLVMLTWKPIPNAEELTVDHLDHNKRNNELTNLEWVSKEENIARAKRDFLNEKISLDYKYYYIYNKNKQELFKFKSVDEVVDTIKKYYLLDYKLFATPDKLKEKIEVVAKSNKALKNKRIGTLLVCYK